jgi:hypothetical protein
MKPNEVATKLTNEALQWEHPGSVAKCKCGACLYQHSQYGIDRGANPCGHFRDENPKRRLKSLMQRRATYREYRNLLANMEVTA